MTHTFAFLTFPRGTGRRVAYTFPLPESDYVDWLTTRHAEHAAIMHAVGDGPPHHLLRFAHRVITCVDYAPDNRRETCYHCHSATGAAKLAYESLRQEWAEEDKQQGEKS
jgi:hypothetical protein